jgi:hypothetical protein
MLEKDGGAARAATAGVGASGAALISDILIA